MNRAQLQREALQQALTAGELVRAPGVYDALTAKIAVRAGFRAVYASGGAIARSMGYPDVGLVTFTEMATRLREIVQAVDVPVIADADTGYGNAINAVRTVREYEAIGVAAFHLEDQVTPKRCGHYDAKALVSVAEMTGKLRAAVEARSDRHLLLIARTDAIAVEGLDRAIERGHRYLEAGADALFIEAPRSEAELAAIGRAFRVPLVANMFEGGKTPYLPPERLRDLGYRIVIHPSDLQRAAIYAMQEAARRLLEEGTTRSIADRMATFRERDEIVGLPEVEAMEARYLRGVVEPE